MVTLLQIVRVYIRVRQLLQLYSEILKKLDDLQTNDAEQDQQIQLIFEYHKKLEDVKKEEVEFKERKKDRIQKK